MNKPSEYWIKKLQLSTHPEGGYFRETYRSTGSIPASGLPEKFTGKRDYATAIYFLLKGNQFSAFHRLKSDETWHYYAGCSLTLLIINADGNLEKHLLGPAMDKGEHFHITIRASQWFAAQPNNPDTFTLCGCTVAPGFDFDDFEMGGKEELLELYPHLEEIVERFCL